MNAISIVPATAVAYTLAAVGTLALVKAVWKRAPKGDETLLLMGALASLAGVFTAVGASQGRTWNVGGMEEPERVSGSRVSASLFPMLGLRAERGRLFRPDEEEAGRVAIISSGLWERRFASDPAVVGRSVLIDGEAHTIVGVMQRGVRYPEQDDLWLPLSPGALRGHRDWRVYQVVARLAPGVTVAQADARVAQLMRENAGRYPTTNSEWSSWIVPQNDLVAREVRAIFLIMLGAVGFVLLTQKILKRQGTGHFIEIMGEHAPEGAHGALIDVHTGRGLASVLAAMAVFLFFARRLQSIKNLLEGHRPRGLGEAEAPLHAAAGHNEARLLEQVHELRDVLH